MSTPTQSSIVNAATIPPLTHDEAGTMARTELAAFLTQVKALTAEDWEKPTDCPLWDVRQILAHQTGSYASFASWAEFRRQWGQLFRRRPPDQLPVDAINERQVADRANASPAELIAELEVVGPKAIATRQRLPWTLRALRIPFGPPLGFVRFDYLTDLIYTRDTWSHRLDICRATGRPMHLTPDHDDRLIALVMRDVAAKFSRNLPDLAVIYDLIGPAGSAWQIGSPHPPQATLQMDTLDFSRLSSGRLTANEVRSQSLVNIQGDVAAAHRALDQTAVPY